MASSPHKIRFISIPGKESVARSPDDARKILQPADVPRFSTVFRDSSRVAYGSVAFRSIGQRFGVSEGDLEGPANARSSFLRTTLSRGGF